MAPRNRYPLEPVVRHRHHQVDERARELGERNRQAAEAAQQRASAEKRLDDHEHQTRDIAGVETDRVAEGDASVADLLRLEAWNVARVEQAKALQRSVTQTRGTEQHAAAQQATALGCLSNAHADACVIDQHRDAHQARERAREEAALEEEAGEVHASRRPRSTG